MNTSEIIMLIAILIWTLAVGPFFSLREMKNLRAASKEELPTRRRCVFRRTIIEQWSVVTVLLVAWVLLGNLPAEIGLNLGFAGWQWLALALSLGAAGIFTWKVWQAANQPEDLQEVREQLGIVALIAPHTRSELKHFCWVSLTAGICEEILYRGFLMTLLTSVMGLWPAVLASSVVFGVGHAYQGAGGILKTGVAGLILALVVVTTGSLPVAMLIHVVGDMVQGRLLFTATNEDNDLAGRFPPSRNGLDDLSPDPTSAA